MGIRFTIDKSAQLVVYVVEGDATPDEARSFLDAVQAHPDFERDFNFLGDRRGDDRTPGGAYIRSLSHAVSARQEELGPCLWAVIAGDDPSFGMAQMWARSTESSAVKVVPFRTATAAVFILGLSNAAAPLLLVPTT